MIDFGISKGQFLEESFGRGVYLKRGALSETTFSWERLDDILYCVEPKAPFMTLFRDGLVPENSYTEDYNDIGILRRRLVKSKFYEHMRNGATLVLNRIDWKSLEIRDLCMQVSHFVQQQVVANGYVAFGGEGTFGKHWDTHDVFVLQLLGRKKWQVFKPTFELPLSSQTSKLSKHECPTDPAWEGYLEAGDLLYVPKGWWHEAKPTAQETFHVSIGVHTPLVIDYLIWACANCFPSLKECRESLFLDSRSIEKIRSALISIGEELVSLENLLAFRNRMQQKERAMSNVNLNMLIRKGAIDLEENAKIRLNSAYFDALGKVSINGIQVPGDRGFDGILSILKTHSECSLGKLFEQLSEPAEQLRFKVHEMASLDIIEIL